MNDCKATRRAIAGVSLLGALLAAGCSGVGSGWDNFNKPSAFEGPGCYDHKNRIERTITTPVECGVQGWVWKTAP